jgi:hypothetical protein
MVRTKQADYRHTLRGDSEVEHLTDYLEDEGLLRRCELDGCGRYYLEGVGIGDLIQVGYIEGVSDGGNIERTMWICDDHEIPDGWAKLLEALPEEPL